MRSPQERHFDVLQAELITGTTATLLNAHASVWAPERVRISAAAALVGRSFPARPTVDVCEVQVQVTSLDAIASTVPLGREIHFPTEGGTVLYGIAPSPDAKKVWEDDCAVLTIDYAARTAPADLYRHHHVFSPYVKIELDESVPFMQLSKDWLDSLRRLASVSTGKPEDITLVSVVGEDDAQQDGRWQVFASGVTQSPYASSEEVVRNTHSALSLSRDGDSLLALLRTWRQLDTSLHPIIQSFGYEIRTFVDLTPRAKFLTLVQAVEGAYKAENVAKIEADSEKYTGKRDTLLGKLADADLAPAERRFLDKNLSSNPPTNLETALHWSAKLVPSDIAAALERATIVADKQAGGSDITWAAAVRLIRNDLSHGNRAYHPSDLMAVVAPLRRHVTSLTLLLLGASTAAQERAAQEARI
jgi:hypothetical protein